MSDTKCSSTDSSEPGIDLEIDSEGESQRASTQKMSRPSEASEVLRASNSQARDVRLTSKELDDCRVLSVKRRDMLEDGCEVLAQEQARQARLELRSPQEASEDTQVHVAGLEEDARLRTGALEDDIQMHLIVALEEDARVLVTGMLYLASFLSSFTHGGAPVVVLLGPVGVGKSLLATALAGLPPSNRIFKVGDSAQAVTLEAVCHRCRWFGRASEEELVLVDPPGVGDGEKDTTRLAQVVRLLRDLGSVSLFVVVLNSEQPRIGSVLENLLRLMEECFGRRFWRHVALVFTRYYTDARSARRRGSKTKDMLRDEFSMALATQFPHSQQERTLAADPFPSYFVDSEAAINNELPEAERAAALMELERLSVFARASPCLPTGTDDNTSVGSSTARGREPDTEQECSEDHFATGSWVEIHGLVGTPSLNGALQ
ncbi:AIG1 family protein [Durusdinium trenchii]|uniref:AIG1 family protein n=1 Tax=Durusdinium trenchii TaxID=1381693 RepID=A0ABP0KU88_9DINO